MTGVKIEELNEVEKLFDLHIDVFALRDLTTLEKKNKGKNQKTSATVLRLSDRPSDRAVNLLICFQDTDMPHYMLVKDTKELLKKLVCPHCSAILKRLEDYKKHVPKCEEGRARHVYPGGFHKQPLGIREKLESVGIKMPEDLAYYKEFICYDFESMFKKFSEKQKKPNTSASTVQCPMSYVTVWVRPSANVMKTLKS